MDKITDDDCMLNCRYTRIDSGMNHAVLFFIYPFVRCLSCYHVKKERTRSYIYLIDSTMASLSVCLHFKVSAQTMPIKGFFVLFCFVSDSVPLYAVRHKPTTCMSAPKKTGTRSA